MPFKRFSSKSRRAIRPTGTKTAKKKAAKVFGFKKFLNEYPAAPMALNYANRRTSYRTYYPAYLKPGIPYSRSAVALQKTASKVVDLATSSKARITSSSFKSMKLEEELKYSTITSLIDPKEPAKGTSLRYVFGLKVTIAELISNVVLRMSDRFKDIKDYHFITFDRLSVKVRLYGHPVSGMKPYHGYNWDPVSAMLTEESNVPTNLEYGKSYNGKGFMSMKFNITGFVTKHGGSPYVKLTPTIDLTTMKQTLRLAPTLHLYAHYPSEADKVGPPPELGRVVTKIYYRLHRNDMQKETEKKVASEDKSVNDVIETAQAALAKAKALQFMLPFQ